MWHSYTPNHPRSLALVGSVRSLTSAFQNKERSFFESPVRYCRSESPRPQFDYKSIFFYKDKERFGWEKEFRFLCSLQDSDMPFRLDPPEGRRIMFPFNCRTGIKRVVIHPNAPKEYRAEVEAKCRSLFPRLKQVEASIFRS